MVAGAWAGVDAVDVPGVKVPALVMLAVVAFAAAFTSKETGET